MVSINCFSNKIKHVILQFITTGDYGIFTGSTGLKLAYVSGKQKTDSNQQSGFSMDSIKSIEVQLLNDSQFAGVDILLTSQWPSGIENFAASLVISHLL